MNRRRAALACALTAAALTAGCGAGSQKPQELALAMLNTPPPQAPATAPSPAAPPCGDVTASLRPPAVMPAPGAMPAGSYMAHIKRRGYLIAGVDENTLLFSYFNPVDQRVEGFEIDLLHRLAQAIFDDPKAIRLQAVTTAERISAVRSGAVDVVADAMTITCARRRQVDFSAVYYDAGQQVLVPRGSTARSVRDLAGRRVCAAAGTTSLEVLRSLPAPRPVPYIVAQRTDCLVALQQGTVAGITSDDAILLGYRAQDPYTRIAGARFAPDPYGMAISRAHPDFVRFVNGVLERMRADGSWRAIFAHWLGPFVAVPAPPTPHYSG